MARASRSARPGMRDLCLAGGVALNCVGNGRLLREGPFERLGFSPRPAMPAARSAWRSPLASVPRQAGALSPRDWTRRRWERAGSDAPSGRGSARLGGAQRGRAEPDAYADGMSGFVPRSAFLERRDRDVVDAAAGSLPARRATRPRRRGRGAARQPRRSSACCRAAWSSARARSAAARIIGDARSPKMQSVMNLKIKFREVVPAVRAGRAAGARRTSGSSSTATAPTCCWSRTSGPTRRLPVTDDAEDALGHREAERAALDGAGGHARRLLGAHPDGAPRDQPALLRHHRGVPPPDRLPGDRQHVVQRARRADRVHARGRLPVLHAHGHGRRSCSRTASSRRRTEQPPGRRGDWRAEYQLD